MARLGRRSDVRAQFVPGSLCCDHEGYSLHEEVLVLAGQRDRFEHLCR